MNLRKDKHALQHVCILMPRAKSLKPIAISCMLTLLYWHIYILYTDWHNCTFAYLHICILAHFYTCTFAYLHIYTLAHIHTCTFANLHICILAHFHTCTFAPNTQICASLPLNSLKTQKKQSGADRRTDILTNTVTYRDANIVNNSPNTQICASLPLKSLKNAKKAKWDRQTDGPTDQHGDL